MLKQKKTCPYSYSFIHSQENHNRARCAYRRLGLTASPAHADTCRFVNIKNHEWNSVGICIFFSRLASHSLSANRIKRGGERGGAENLFFVHFASYWPLLNFIKQSGWEAKEFRRKTINFCVSQSGGSVVTKRQQQQSQRTRIMLMSLMISQMFHLLLVRASFPFLLSLCFIRGS